MSGKPGYVFGYVDPDTDGVMSAIGYARFRRKRDDTRFVPVVFGDTDGETDYVFERTDLDRPRRITELPDGAAVALVDTHHPEQLPDAVDPADVVEIVDHHPGGPQDAFPNATVQNEPVGAAATLVAERFHDAGIRPDPEVATGLAVAVVSNTLNFAAPSACDRDRVMYEWLNRYGGVDDGFVDEMFERRHDLAGTPTVDALESDFKRIHLGDIQIGVSQLEIVDLTGFLERSDIRESLTTLREELALDHVVFNGVDVRDHESALVVDDELERLYAEAVGVTFENGIARVDDVVLRKSHVVPPLESKYGTE